MSALSVVVRQKDSSLRRSEGSACRTCFDRCLYSEIHAVLGFVELCVLWVAALGSGGFELRGFVCM